MNEDGVIGKTEAEKMPSLAESFQRVDCDADGLIGEKEFEAARR